MDRIIVSVQTYYKFWGAMAGLPNMAMPVQAPTGTGTPVARHASFPSVIAVEAVNLRASNGCPPI